MSCAFRKAKIKTETNSVFTDLYSVFRKIGLQGQHLSRVHVRVVRFFERLLQFLKLVACEDGSANETPTVMPIMVSNKPVGF
jgi:hypothetical protein